MRTLNDFTEFKDIVKSITKKYNISEKEIKELLNSHNNEITTNKMLLKREVSTLKNDKVNLEKLNNVLEQDKVNLEQDKVNLEQDKKELNTTISNLENDKVNLEQDKKELSTTISNLENDKVNLEQDKKELSTTISNLEKDKVILEQDKVNIEQDKKELSTIVSNYKKNIGTGQKLIKAIQELEKRHKIEQENLEKMINANKVIPELLNKIDSLLESNYELKEEVKKLQEENKLLFNSLNKSNDLLLESNYELKEEVKKSQEVNDSVFASLNKSNESIQNEMCVTKTEIATAQGDITKIQSRIDCNPLSSYDNIYKNIILQINDEDKRTIILNKLEYLEWKTCNDGNLVLNLIYHELNDEFNDENIKQFITTYFPCTGEKSFNLKFYEKELLDFLQLANNKFILPVSDTVQHKYPKSLNTCNSIIYYKYYLNDIINGQYGSLNWSNNIPIAEALTASKYNIEIFLQINPGMPNFLKYITDNNGSIKDVLTNYVELTALIELKNKGYDGFKHLYEKNKTKIQLLEGVNNDLSKLPKALALLYRALVYNIPDKFIPKNKYGICVLYYKDEKYCIKMLYKEVTQDTTVKRLILELQNKISEQNPNDSSIFNETIFFLTVDLIKPYMSKEECENINKMLEVNQIKIDKEQAQINTNEISNEELNFDFD